MCAYCRANADHGARCCVVRVSCRAGSPRPRSPHGARCFAFGPFVRRAQRYGGGGATRATSGPRHVPKATPITTHCFTVTGPCCAVQHPVCCLTCDGHLSRHTYRASRGSARGSRCVAASKLATRTAAGGRNSEWHCYKLARLNLAGIITRADSCRVAATAGHARRVRRVARALCRPTRAAAAAEERQAAKRPGAVCRPAMRGCSRRVVMCHAENALAAHPRTLMTTSPPAPIVLRRVECGRGRPMHQNKCRAALRLPRVMGGNGGRSWPW
jgi:hypothetical protein